MFPIRDDNPHFLTPVVTVGLIGLNVAMWILVQGLGMEPALSNSVCTLGLIPGELLQTIPAGTALPLSRVTACVIEGSPSWHTPITSMFLHGGWFHIIFNMWFMWIFGNNVEDSMGHVRFLVFYLVCGLAIGGVMGAYIVLYPRVNVHMLVIFGFYVTTIAVPAALMLGYWLLAQLIGGWVSSGSQGGGVAFWAHVGGFAAGAVLIFPFRNPRLLARHPYYGWARKGQPTSRWRRVR